MEPREATPVAPAEVNVAKPAKTVSAPRSSITMKQNVGNKNNINGKSEVLYESSIIESRLVNVYDEPTAQKGAGRAAAEQSVCQQESSSVESLVTEQLVPAS